MAKKKAPKAPGMYSVEVTSDEAGKLAYIDDLRAEIYREDNLDWLRELRDNLMVIYGPESKADDDDPLTFTGKQLLAEAEVILNPKAAECPLPRVIRWSYNLGRLHERWALQNTFDPLVASARVVSKSNAIKGGHSDLDDRQWAKIAATVDGRAKGVSIIEACRQVSAQLMTGKVRKLPHVRAEIGEDAIYKQWKKRQSGKAV